MENNEEKNINQLAKEKVEELMKQMIDNGLVVDINQIKMFSDLVDIHKDLANEEYWKEKNEMRYSYGNYGDEYGAESYGRRGVKGTGRGRYRAGGSYGARGYDAKYRGEEMMGEMADNYGAYMEGKEYGAYGSPEMDKAFDYMLKSAEDFFNHLMQEADSPEQIEKIKKTAKKISMMGM